MSNLGFWSGNTGGLSLTGTDAVSTFSEKPPTPAETAAASAGARLLPDKELTTLFKQSGRTTVWSPRKSRTSEWTRMLSASL